MTEKILVCPTSSEESAVSLSYFAAYIAVFVATGAHALMVRATSILPSILNSLNTKSIITGIRNSLTNDTKYTSFFAKIFLKLQFAKNVPKTIIAMGELQAPILSSVVLKNTGSVGCNKNSGIPIRTLIEPGLKIRCLSLISASPPLIFLIP